MAMEINVRKGYKAFKKGLICAPDAHHVKQYQENTTYEEDGGKICHAGMMHYCLNPLDCLEHYPLIDENGDLTEFCEVEALDKPVTDDGVKYASKKLHIGARFALRDWISASVDFFKAQIQSSGTGEVGGNYAKQVGGYYAQQVGGNSAQQVGGNYAQQVGGNYAKQVGGYYAQQVGGDAAKQVGGYYAQQVGGDTAQQVGGDAAKQVGGNAAQQVGGNTAQQVGGDTAKQVGGNYAQQVGGNTAQQVGGDTAQQVGGNYAQQVGGKNSVIVAGQGGRFKAGMNSLIVRYWRDREGNISGYKVAIVDGATIKADTWYKLENGEFVEVRDE